MAGLRSWRRSLRPRAALSPARHEHFRINAVGGRISGRPPHRGTPVRLACETRGIEDWKRRLERSAERHGAAIRSHQVSESMVEAPPGPAGADAYRSYWQGHLLPH